MAITDAELLSRLVTLAEAVQILQTVVTKKGSKQMFRQALELRQQQIAELEARVETLEAQITLINNNTRTV
jgi:cell division protein FtsB